MPQPVEVLAAQALSLPPEDRAKLVERLIASFEPKSPAQAAWLVVAQGRRAEVAASKVAMSQVRTRLPEYEHASSDVLFSPRG